MSHKRSLSITSSVLVREPQAAGSFTASLAPVELNFRWLALAVKRAFDIVSSALLLFLALPLFAVIALFVAMDGGPVFFAHKRIGRGGKVFGCLKFRTMILDAEGCLNEYLSHHPHAAIEWQREQKLNFDPRVTAIGRFLRSSSLDELPQLINVLLGDMSLVGPRPVTSSELTHYGSSVEFYKSVRPGITGLWQVSGRNDVGYATRVALDERYVREWNLALDASILLRTPMVVLSRQGAR
ncbi:sugar transferase [Microvirga flavescens]|uniref:sugar transferase n=1 Tax=Microvirga flavescens TaxID=2249811 RepID=UPI000DD74E0A|nr:sugar transferase [Microvirga flavescens]